MRSAKDSQRAIVSQSCMPLVQWASQEKKFYTHEENIYMQNTNQQTSSDVFHETRFSIYI